MYKSNSFLTTYDEEILSEVAISLEAKDRAGTFILKNYSNICSYSDIEGIELLPVKVALDRYDWLNDKYFWSQISPSDISFPEGHNITSYPHGYFLRVHKGKKIKLPVQTALYMSGSSGRQVLHNVIILEEGAELTLITGCVSHPELYNGEHVSINETYIGKNAGFTQTMVHSWSPNVTVLPYSATVVDDGGIFINNYILLRSPERIESNPVTYLNGRNSSAKYFSVIFDSENSIITTGGDVFLNGENTSAEIEQRAVCTGGQITQKGLLIGKAECKAHVDCSGMLINPGQKGFIKSVPGLQAYHPDALMSHEASIGKIAPQQVQYLMARGMEERDAVSMIVRGFLDVDIKGLGAELDMQISKISQFAGHGE